MCHVVISTSPQARYEDWLDAVQAAARRRASAGAGGFDDGESSGEVLPQGERAAALAHGTTEPEAAEGAADDAEGESSAALFDKISRGLQYAIPRARAGLCHAPRGVEEPASALRLTILEIGAGGNVTTVRHESEQIAERMARAGARVALVRVNPQLPLLDGRFRDYSHWSSADDSDDDEADADAESGAAGGGAHAAAASPPGRVRVVSVMSRGLAALREIDAAMQRRMGEPDPGARGAGNPARGAGAPHEEDGAAAAAATAMRTPPRTDVAGDRHFEEHF